MDKIKDRLEAFKKLGVFLNQFSTKEVKRQENIPHNELFFDGFKHQLKLAEEANAWFSKENLLFAIEGWSKLLTEDNLQKWIKNQKISSNHPKTVAIVMAGNIPLVGFHDFLSVLISGHSVLIKQSSNDQHILPFLAKYIEFLLQELKGKIQFTQEKLSDFDAVIATGSNNTARYFEYYFKGKPNIIRKNRNSVAVITGKESEKDLENLGEDIFRYFGLGCRSVSKLFVPKGYDFDLFFKAMYKQHKIIHNVKYANNYDYNKAVYLMSEFDIIENGFLMIKEDKSYSSPIASVFYEYYDNNDNLKIKLYKDREKIQCIVANNFIENEVDFGQTQRPKLWDYADGVNTLEFLANL